MLHELNKQGNGDGVDLWSPGGKAGEVARVGLDLPLALGAPETFGYVSMGASGLTVLHCWRTACGPGKWMVLAMIQTGAGGAAVMVGSKTGAVMAPLLSKLKLKTVKGQVDFERATGRSCSGLTAT